MNAARLIAAALLSLSLVACASPPDHGERVVVMSDLYTGKLFGGFGPAQGAGGSGTATLTAIGALTPTDGNVIVGNGTTWVAENGNVARTSLGLGSGSSPTWASGTFNGGVNVGGAAGAATGQVKFHTGLGATNHIFGPSDQALIMRSNAGRSFILDGSGGIHLYSGASERLRIAGAWVDIGAVEFRMGSAIGTPQSGIMQSASGVVKVTDGAGGNGSLRSAGEQINSTGRIIWNSNTTHTGSDDLALARLGAGQVAVQGGNSQALNLRSVTTQSAALSGATVTLASARPAGSIIVGITLRVTTAVTSGDGGTTFTVGDGSDADRYGSGIAFTLGTTTTLASHTASPLEWLGAAGDVVLTCTGGTFSGGVVRLSVHYLDLTAPGS